MTTLSDFSEDERTLILDAPGAVLKAAVVADGRPGPIKLFKELAAGTKVLRTSQQDENLFVRAVAVAIRERASSGSGGSSLPEADEAVSTALDQAEQTLTLLRTKAGDDAEAYGAWLVRIATQAGEAAKSRTGGLFSRKATVGPGERVFIERLAEIVKA